MDGMVEKLCHEVREKISGIIHTFRDQATEGVDKICGNKASHKTKHDLETCVHKEFHDLESDLN